MKKCLIVVPLLVTVSFMLLSCSKDEDNNEDDKIIVNENASKIVGVWSSEGYFVSFATDGSYKAYLGDYFMDSGTYTYKDGIIDCVNLYSYTHTTYDLKSVNDKNISLIAHYVETENNTNKVETLNYSKKQQDGFQMNNNFIGKTYSGGLNILGSYSYYFQSSYLMTCTITKEGKIHTQNWNYCYVEPYLYIRKYTNEMGISLYTGGCNDGKVYKKVVSLIDNWLQIKDWD
jgi:hypothetical protein